MPSKAPTNKRPYAILIGLDTMQGLQAARILAKYDIPVIAIAQDKNHPNCLTNVCEDILFAPNGHEEVMAHLYNIGKKLTQKAVLFPCQDSNVTLVSKERAKLQDCYHIALPPHETVDMLMDKIKFYLFAQKQGLRVPKTYILKSEEDALRAAEELTFPCAMKPPYRSKEWSQNTTLKAFKAADKEEFLSLYRHYSQWADVLIAQTWIAGTDENLFSCNCYFDADSKPLITFVARKLRQWPPRTGQSSLGVECRDDEVLEETLRLFKSVNYYGLGYVEIKQDANTGEYFIVEPNIGRPTGRSAIAEAGGVELLYTMYCDVLGLPLPQGNKQAYEGVKWVHLRRDLQSALHYWRAGELTLKEWWQSMRGRKGYAVFSWRDPAPFFSDFYRTLRLLMSKGERSKRGI